LNKNEIVHHIDYVKNNNKIGNLYVTDHKGHAKAHSSVLFLISSLLKNKTIYFNAKKGEYFLTKQEDAK